jgi:hypothetical protein
MKIHEQSLSAVYNDKAASDFLEYMNEFLTVARWAEDHGMEYQQALDWLARGKRVHNRRAESLKAQRKK